MIIRCLLWSMMIPLLPVAMPSPTIAKIDPKGTTIYQGPGSPSTGIEPQRLAHHEKPCQQEGQAEKNQAHMSAAFRLPDLRVASFL